METGTLYTASARRQLARLGTAVAIGAIAGAMTAACNSDEDTPERNRARGTDTSFEARLEAAFAELDERHMPVCVAIAHGDEPIEVRAFGALAEQSVAAESMLVDLGSVTKTITGAMAAKLVEQHKARFDETLAEFFGDAVPADKRDITLHQLLTHSAGFDEISGDDFEPIDRPTFLARAFESELLASPGETYAYSNVGYGIVAAIIETRSDKPYDEFLRVDLLDGQDLELGYASVYDDTRSVRSASGDTIEGASWGDPEPHWNLIGNGGLVATATDVIRFRQKLVAGELISPDLVAELQTPHIAEEEDGDSFYGYGVVVQTVPGLGQVYWHDGGNDVFSAQWTDYADQHDVIFTAGADSDEGDAFEAMLVMATQLYDYRD